MFRSKNAKFLNQNLFYFILLFISPTIIFIVQDMTPMYFNNDDYFLKQLVSGEFTGTPDPHLVHIGYLSGVLISHLYKFLPTVPWYGLFMFGYAFLATVLSFGTFLKCTKKIWQKVALTIFSLCVMYGFLFSHLLQIQFTTVTAIVCAAAMVHFYTAKDEANLPAYLRKQIPSLLLFCISMELRSNACIMFLPMFIFLGIARLLQNRSMKKVLLTYGCIVVGLTIVLLGIDKLAYSSDSWQTFIQYSNDRAAIVDYEDYPPYEENMETYQTLGLSEASYVAAKDGYMLLLDSHIDANFMETVKNISPDSTSTVSEIVNAFITMHKEPQYDWPINRIVFLLYACVVFMILLCGKYSCLWDIAAVFGGRMIIWIYILYIGRPLPRVTQGIYIAELLLLLAIFFHHKLWHPKNDKLQLPTAVLSAGILAGVVLLSARWGFPYVESIHSKNDVLETASTTYSEVYEYMLDHQENFYLLDVWSFIDLTEPVFSAPLNQANNFTLLGGWTANSPWTDVIRQNQGFTTFEQATLERDNVFFVFQNEPDTPYTYLEDYYRDKHPETTIEVYDTFTTSTGVEFLILECN